jgi:hypothetical protein
MVSRILILMLLLAFAGQALAAACPCAPDGGRAVHSCCKPDSSDAAYFTMKGCCESPACSMSDGGQAYAKSERPAFHQKPVSIAQPRAVPVVTAVTAPEPRPFSDRRPNGHRLRNARAPDLYVRHHAFLI